MWRCLLAAQDEFDWDFCKWNLFVALRNWKLLWKHSHADTVQGHSNLKECEWHCCDTFHSGKCCYNCWNFNHAIYYHVTHYLKHCVTCQNLTLTGPLETKPFEQFFQAIPFIMPFKGILFCLMSLANSFTGVLFLTRNSYKLKLSNGERRKRKRDRLRNGEVLRRNFSHNMKNYKERDKLRSEEKWKPRIVLLIRGESWIFTVNTISQCSFAFC